MNCDRCGGRFREALAYRFPRIIGYLCVSCGEYLDEVVLQNRTLTARELWRRKTDLEFAVPLSRRERILREYEERPIYY